MLVDGVFGLEQGVGHQLAGILVGEAVEDTLPLLAAGDHAGQPQLGEMLGNGGGRLVDGLGDLPDGERSRSCSARMMRTLVGSASIEKTATARSMYSGSGEPRTGLSAFMCR